MEETRKARTKIYSLKEGCIILFSLLLIVIVQIKVYFVLGPENTLKTIKTAKVRTITDSSHP